MDDSNGRITSPNYPQNYGNNVSCYWFLSSNGDSIILEFATFDTEEQDTVLVYDVSQHSVLVNSYRGWLTNNTAVNISSNHIKIIFTTNGFNRSLGFVLNYQFGKYHMIRSHVSLYLF